MGPLIHSLHSVGRSYVILVVAKAGLHASLHAGKMTVMQTVFFYALFALFTSSRSGHILDLALSLAMLWSCRTAGDVLRNFGARELTGVRGAYERLIKVGYGLSILGTVPLVVLPFQDSLGPLLALCLKPAPRSSDKKQDAAESADVQGSVQLQEHIVTTAVLGRRLGVSAPLQHSPEDLFWNASCSCGWCMGWHDALLLQWLHGHHLQYLLLCSAWQVGEVQFCC